MSHSPDSESNNSFMITDVKRKLKKILFIAFRFRQGFVEVFCSCQCKQCKLFKKMHGKDRPLSPAGHFAMTEKYALMYYDDDQTKKNGTGKLECFCENECGL
jgi:hypothetical protein